MSFGGAVCLLVHPLLPKAPTTHTCVTALFSFSNPLYFFTLLSSVFLPKLHFSYETFALRFRFPLLSIRCMHFLPLKDVPSIRHLVFRLGFPSNQIPWPSEASISSGWLSDPLSVSYIHGSDLIASLSNVVSQF